MTPYLCIALSKDGARTCRIDVGTIGALFSEHEEEPAGASERPGVFLAAGVAVWRTGGARAADLIRLLRRKAEARRRQQRRPAPTLSAC